MTLLRKESSTSDFNLLKRIYFQCIQYELVHEKGSTEKEFNVRLGVYHIFCMKLSSWTEKYNMFYTS